MTEDGRRHVARGVQGVRCRVQGRGVQGAGSMMQGSRDKVQVAGCREEGARCYKVQGAGCSEEGKG